MAYTMIFMSVKIIMLGLYEKSKSTVWQTANAGKYDSSVTFHTYVMYKWCFLIF